jgi:hypothetical protein
MGAVNHVDKHRLQVGTGACPSEMALAATTLWFLQLALLTHNSAAPRLARLN